MPSRLCESHKIVKRTVSLHPNVDEVVRLVQASMIENGWKANYSDAMNTVVTAYFYDVARFRCSDTRSKELVQLTGSFLNGSDIAKEDVARFSKAVRKIGRQYEPQKNSP